MEIINSKKMVLEARVSFYRMEEDSTTRPAQRGQHNLDCHELVEFAQYLLRQY